MNDREGIFTIDEDKPKKELVNHPKHYGGKDNILPATYVTQAELRTLLATFTGFASHTSHFGSHFCFSVHHDISFLQGHLQRGGSHTLPHGILD